jgi:methylglutaconyl-CoA hydratase
MAQHRHSRGHNPNRAVDSGRIAARPTLNAQHQMTETEQDGTVNLAVDSGIATVTFFHPKRNALPASILRRLAEAIDNAGKNPDARVVILASEGTGAFCAGASFDELRAVQTFEDAKEFFSGFAHVILAMRRCPKIIIGRIQGKAVGGGVGLVAATDYSFALDGASVRLSELAIGLGPFVIGPVVERKVGRAAYAAMAIDADWRDAEWAHQHGLYTRVMDTEPALESVLPAFAHRLAGMNPEALKEIKRVLWEGTNHWETLLFERAAISGKLALSDYCKRAVERAQQSTHPTPLPGSLRTGY